MKEFFDAIRRGDRDAVAAMIARDPAVLRATDDNGLGAYTVARYSRQEEIASLLLQNGVDLDVFAATLAGDYRRVQQLLENQPDLAGSYSHDGWTPLHLASFFGQTNCARVLLAGGADVHARSRNGMTNTALHAAAAGRRREIAAMLIEHGADLNARQQGGWTALHSAAQNGDTELVKLLVANGASVTCRADNNQSPLDLALTHGNAEIAELLEERAADRGTS